MNCAWIKKNWVTFWGIFFCFYLSNRNWIEKKGRWNKKKNWNGMVKCLDMCRIWATWQSENTHLIRVTRWWLTLQKCVANNPVAISIADSYIIPSYTHIYAQAKAYTTEHQYYNTVRDRLSKTRVHVKHWVQVSIAVACLPPFVIFFLVLLLPHAQFFVMTHKIHDDGLCVWFCTGIQQAHYE